MKITANDISDFISHKLDTIKVVLEVLTRIQILKFKKYLSFSDLEKNLFDFIRERGIFLRDRYNENMSKTSSKLGLQFKKKESIYANLTIEEISKAIGSSKSSVEKSILKLLKMRWILKSKEDFPLNSKEKKLYMILGSGYTIAPSISYLNFKKMEKENANSTAASFLVN